MATQRMLRRRARGASLVEALVTIPFFIAIFIGMVFFSRLYLEKQRAISESRERAWTYAMGNCEGSTPTGASTSKEPMDTNVPNSSDADFQGEDAEYTKGLDSGKLTKESNAAVVTVSGEVSTSERKDADSSAYTTVKKKVSSTATVTCNEKAVDGDIGSAIGRAWDIIWGKK